MLLPAGHNLSTVHARHGIHLQARGNEFAGHVGASHTERNATASERAAKTIRPSAINLLAPELLFF